MNYPRGPLAWADADRARPRARGARRAVRGAARGALPRRAGATRPRAGPAGSAARPARASSGTTRDARRHLPSPVRGPRRRAARARAERPRRRDRRDRGERRLRLGPPHLPRAREDRARVHDRPRVRRHRAAAGDDVTRVKPGDRVLGCFHSACGTCFYCLKGVYQKCDIARVFGHGELLGNLPGTQAEQALVPNANLTLRKVPEGVPDDVALFAGDVMGTAYHAVDEDRSSPATASPCSGSVRSGCARSRSPSRPAPPRCSRSTPSSNGSMSRSVRRHGGPPHRRRPAQADPAGDRGARRRRRDRRRRPPRRARPRDPDRAQGRNGRRDRRVRRAVPGPHGPRLDQGADAESRPGERDRPRRQRARDARRGNARPDAARHPPHAARRRARPHTRSTIAARP